MSNKKVKSNTKRSEQESNYRKLSSKHAETAAVEDKRESGLAKNNHSSQFSFKNDNKKMKVGDNAQSTARKEARVIKGMQQSRQQKKLGRNKTNDGSLPVGNKQYIRYKQKAQSNSEDDSNRSIQSNKRQKAMLLSIKKPINAKSNNQMTQKQERPQQQPLTKRKKLPKLLFYKNEEDTKMPRPGNQFLVKITPPKVQNKEVDGDNQFIGSYHLEYPQYYYKKNVHEKGEDKMVRLKNKLGFIFDMADRDQTPSVSYYSQSSLDSSQSKSKKSQVANSPMSSNKNIFLSAQRQRQQAIRSQKPERIELSEQRYKNKSSSNNQFQPYQEINRQMQVPKKQQAKLHQKSIKRENEQEMIQQKLIRKPIVIIKKENGKDKQQFEQEKAKYEGQKQRQQKQRQKIKIKQKQRQGQMKKQKQKVQVKDNKGQRQYKKMKSKIRQPQAQKQVKRQKQSLKQKQVLKQRQRQKQSKKQRQKVPLKHTRQQKQKLQQQRQKYQRYQQNARRRQTIQINEDSSTVKDEFNSNISNANGGHRFQIKLEKVLTDNSAQNLQPKRYISHQKQQDRIAKKLNFQKVIPKQQQRPLKTPKRIDTDIQSSRVSQKQEEYLDEQIVELMKKNDEYIGVAKKQIEFNRYQKDKDYPKDSKPKMRKIIHIQPRRRIKTELSQRQEEDNRMLTEKQKQFLRLLKSKQEQILNKIKQEIEINPRPFFGDSYEFKPKYVSGQFDRGDYKLDNQKDQIQNRINPSTRTYEVSKMLPALSVTSTRPKRQGEHHLMYSPITIKHQKESAYSTNMSGEETFNSIKNPNYSIKVNRNEVGKGRYNQKNYDSSDREYLTQNISEKYERLKRLMKRIQ